MRNLDITNSRAKLKLSADQPTDQPPSSSRNGTSSVRCQAGGYDRITDNPQAPGPEEEALDHAADGGRHRLSRRPHHRLSGAHK